MDDRNRLRVISKRSERAILPRAKQALLACGIAASLLYVAMNVFIAARWEGYSSLSQTVSELSAVDAPTRGLWVPLAHVYTILTTAFGLGIWLCAGPSRALRAAGGFVMAYGLMGIVWPLFPMHQREVLAAGGETWTDTMHLVVAGVTVALTLLVIGFGAAAFNTPFRVYSMATVFVLVVFGGLVGLDAPRVEANLPTPWAGLWERINIGAFLLWTVVLSSLLLRGAGQRRAELTRSGSNLRRGA